MAVLLVPGPVKKARDLLEADPARAWTVGEVASVSGIKRRTLHRQFRRFLGRGVMEFLRDLRLDIARRHLVHSSDQRTVTEIAERCGFNHLGRFAAEYCQRFGETPSTTLRRRQNFLAGTRACPLSFPTAVDRPQIAVLPFDIVGTDARHTATLRDEVAAALTRPRWIAVMAPTRARYHLRGTVRSDGARQLRVTVTLNDALMGKHVWADRWSCDCLDSFDLEERVITRIVTAIQQSVREAEIDQALRKDTAAATSWELTMQALPRVLSTEPVAQEVALEVLERAIEKAPHDPLPIALKAWCHGLRGSHNLCEQPEKEKNAAHVLSARAGGLNKGDALSEAILAAAYTLARDFAAATLHVDRALAMDSGSAWAWGRLGWLKAYTGESIEAIECFQIARSLAPVDPMGFLCAVGIGASHFGAHRYDESARWFTRALSENPNAVWINHVLSPAYALAGRKDQAQQSLTDLTRAFPDLTIAQVRSGLPYRDDYLDLVADGLESAGMR